MRGIKTLVLLGFITSAFCTANAWALTLCEHLLASNTLHAAYYKIDIGGGDEEPTMGEVIVIRDKGIKERETGNFPDRKPEDGEEKDDRQPRPEMDVPQPEPMIQEITPTPRKERDKMPIPILIIPDADKAPPLKKPTKPQLN
jgi:hypothetical protein